MGWLKAIPALIQLFMLLPRLFRALSRKAETPKVEITETPKVETQQIEITQAQPQKAETPKDPIEERLDALEEILRNGA